MEIFIAWIYQYRKKHRHRGNQIRHALILDEGHTIFSWYKEQQEAAGMPEIDRLAKLLREFGESLVVADQEASKLTDSIKANTMTKVLLSTGDQKQFQEMTGSMNLNELQKEWAQILDTGESVIQHGNVEPVPVKLKNHVVSKDVSDRELADAMQQKWKQLSYTPLSKCSNGQETLDQYS
jgi:hypothetical protein